MEITKLIQLFLPLGLSGVFCARQYSNKRVIERIDEIDFMTRKIHKTSDGIEIELQILDSEKFYVLLANEAYRFLLASMITKNRATQNQNMNAAWQVIEQYYSAYYAAHYLIRLTGTIISNLDKNTIISIQKSNLNNQKTIEIPTGLYVLEYNSENNTLFLRKNLNKKSGGSHQELWHLWARVVEDLIQEANKDPVEYASISLDLIDHSKFLIKSTNQYTPPDVRGYINYQFKGAVWEFEGKISESVRLKQLSISDEKFSGPINNTNPDGLILNNKILITLAKEVFKYNADKFPRSISTSLMNKYSHHFD